MVFTDLIMPEMSGWQLAEEIKTISSTTPVALITAWTLNMEVAELRSKGIDFIVFKPFRDEQLQKLVQDSMAIKEKYACTAS
jgi:FixJ family two-component response regulator